MDQAHLLTPAERARAAGIDQHGEREEGVDAHVVDRHDAGSHQVT